MDLRLSRDDSATIAFVLACVFADAIDVDEVRQWADHVIASAPVYPFPDLPHWLVDLSTFDGRMKDLYRIIGFVPDRGFSPQERIALLGIAYERGREPTEPRASPERARAVLAKAPHLRAEFRATFPFLAASLPAAG